MKQRKEPKPFGLLISGVYRSLGLEEPYQQFKALQVWREVVGEAIAEVTTLERFTAGQLYIKVNNAAWRLELNFRKRDIIQRLNKELGSPLVQEIIFR
jgi:predicted nucleic acid-binding Zn ribbon protein|uniref:DUF721 domain-containing protein n=1 Tax=Chlorobium chlorochromatii (strain CaD3) TaxID=340177 RepID=Q3AP18_CHLCH